MNSCVCLARNMSCRVARFKSLKTILDCCEEMVACRPYGNPTDISSLGAVLHLLVGSSPEAQLHVHSVLIPGMRFVQAAA